MRVRVYRSLLCLEIIGAAMLGACDSGQRSPAEILAPPAPSYDMVPIDCHIYEPCWNPTGFFWYITRRYPWQTAGAPQNCTDIHGGCFTPGGGVVMGNGSYYGHVGETASPYEAAADHSWTNFGYISSTHKAQVLQALRDLTRSPYPPECRVIAQEMQLRSAYLFWEGDYAWDNGAWWDEVVQGSHPPGIVALKKTPGPQNIWHADGTYEPDALRRLVMHEGIHMWFDTDVGDSPADPELKRQAMDAMNAKCYTSSNGG